MPAIAVVGAGPGLGLSVAKTFGAQGFDIALISRHQDALDSLAGQLGDLGMTAAGFAADTSDHDALEAALHAATARFGAIDVLEFSPYAGLDVVQPADATVEALQAHMDVQLYGAVTAVRTVLPGMIERGAGTLLFTMGIGSVEPMPMLATLNPPQAALRNWSKNLHNTLASQGIQAASLIVGLGITTETPDYPHMHPDAVAAFHWKLHTERELAEHVLTFA